MVTYEPDPEVKKKKHELFAKEHYPGMLAKLEETIAENGGYLANGKVSIYRQICRGFTTLHRSPP